MPSLLSKLEFELRRRFAGGSAERIIEPSPEIPVSKEVKSEKCHQVRQRPSAPGFELQVFEDEDGDQGCPHLDGHGVGRSADEGLDAEVLLDGLEECLDLPALLIDSGDGGSSQVRCWASSQTAMRRRNRSRPPCRASL